MSLFKALSGSIPPAVTQQSAPASPGSPGLEAGSLLDALQPAPQATQPLELGPMVADNSGLRASIRQAFGTPEPEQPVAVQPRVPEQVRPETPRVDPFMNFANKATGKPHR